MDGPASPLLFNWRFPRPQRDRSQQGRGPPPPTRRGALPTQEDDDELFDLIGAIGTGVSVAQADGLPKAARQVGTDVAEDAAAKLADLKRRGLV